MVWSIEEGNHCIGINMIIITLPLGIDTIYPHKTAAYYFYFFVFFQLILNFIWLVNL